MTKRRAQGDRRKTATTSSPGTRRKPELVDTALIKAELDCLQGQAVELFSHGLVKYDEIIIFPGKPVVPVTDPPLPPKLARWLTTYPDAVKVPVTGYSCLVIPGEEPELCSEADPLLPKSMLPTALRAVRRLNKLPQGTTIHWVGGLAGMKGLCPHFPDAPFAAPFDRHRWTEVVDGRRGRKRVARGKTDPNRPSANRQSDIIAAILNADVPLTRPELVEAMKLQQEGKLGAHLAWMVKNGKLVNVSGQGYWPANRPVPQ